MIVLLHVTEWYMYNKFAHGTPYWDIYFKMIALLYTHIYNYVHYGGCTYIWV